MEQFFLEIQNSYSDLNWFICLSLLVIYFVVDSLYATYTLMVTEYRPYSAATAASLIYLLLAIGVMSYVENFLYVFPIMIGSWLGTFNIVSRKRKSAISNVK